MKRATEGRGGRTLETPEGRWLALEAWRARSGHGLLYFLPLEDEAPAAADRGDRRAALDPGRELADLETAELEELLAGARPLTGTERRLVDRDGAVWLVQSSGPVWAEGETAEGLTGLVFTRLTGPEERVTAPGGHAGRTSTEELLVRLGRARAEAGAGAA